MVDCDCTCAALRQASRFVTRLYDDALAPLGLGINQYCILARLARLGPSIVQDLAKALVMDRSTLGHLLRPLQARGLVRLETSLADARRRTIVLTGEGQDLLARARPLWTAAQARFEDGFGADETRHLRDVLAAVVRSAPASP